MKHLKNSIVLSLLFIIAVSCNKVSTTSTTSSPFETETAVKSTITATATPTETSIPVNLATLTPLPPETQIAITTMEAILEVKPELKEFYFSCCLPSLSLSPDGNWAVFYNSNDEKGSGLSFVNTSSKKQWDIFYYDVTGTVGCDCFLEVVHWSKDGNYVYVAPRVALSAGADLYLLLDAGTQLIRVNLDNGNWADTKMGIGFSFSPNDRFIAYRRGQDIVIHEFQTGNERTFPISKEYVAFGHFIWSPNNKNISFIGSLETLIADENIGGFTLFVLDIDSKKPEIILKNDERYLYPLEWQETNIILLESLYTVDSNGYLEYSGEKFELNLITNETNKLESP